MLVPFEREVKLGVAVVDYAAAARVVLAPTFQVSAAARPGWAAMERQKSSLQRALHFNPDRDSEGGRRVCCAELVPLALDVAFCRPLCLYICGRTTKMSRCGRNSSQRALTQSFPSVLP